MHALIKGLKSCELGLRPRLMKYALAYLTTAGLALVVAVAAAGCKTSSPSQYVSPRVEGRVVDAQSGHPLQNVEVIRVPAYAPPRSSEPPKGATLMERPVAVHTAEDGTFALQSERALAVFRKLGWYSITISFRHPAYEKATFRYTLAEATNAISSEPLVKAGDVRLKKLWSTNAP